jgi:hypothetical protein
VGKERDILVGEVTSMRKGLERGNGEESKRSRRSMQNWYAKATGRL